MALIKEVDFQPLDKIVLTFDKFRTYTTSQEVLDNEKNKDKVPYKDDDGNLVDPIMETKVIKTKIKYNQQVARILATPKLEKDFIVGDEILVDFRSCMPLDGYKEIYIITKYNIIGEVK